MGSATVQYEFILFLKLRKVETLMAVVLIKCLNITFQFLFSLSNLADRQLYLQRCVGKMQTFLN